MVKLGVGLALAAVAAAFLVVAASGARERGRNTYCRNNLRKLGEMAFPLMGSEEPIAETGRKFWQEVRVENFTTIKQGKEIWVTRFGGLNPFGCPVRGVQPLDLSGLTPEELERHMTDPSTIDYRGPRNPPGLSSVRPETVGGDLEGNHGGGGGHVLLVDLSIREVRNALQVKRFEEAAGADTGLVE
jgi:hypothetical protein